MTWGVSNYSATPASNTVINGINIAENCNASGINDAIRQMMADIAVFSGSIVPANYLSGLTLSTAGSSSTFAVAAGSAADSTNTALMALASSLSKTTSAWAVGGGNGALDTGAIAINTWYHVWEIKRPDTGVTDILISLSATTPTMPTNYTLKRRLGAMKTNGSSQWTKFFQYGDLFLWDVMVLDANSNFSSSTAVLFTLSVPTGVQVTAQFSAQLSVNVSNEGIIFTCPDQTDSAVASATVSFSINGTTAQTLFVPVALMTNASAQIRGRAQVGSSFYKLYTTGWVDTRGK